MADVKKVPSPCEKCERPNRADCESKTCKRWQRWFMERWDYWAPLIQQKLKEREGENGHESE